MLSPAQADAMIAAATDRALALCAPDDPPALVALRVGWAVRVDLARAGLTRTGQDVALEEPSEYR